MIDVSIVIATRNRPTHLLSTLHALSRSTHPVRETIVVDSSDRRLDADAFAGLEGLNIEYLESPPSVCAQRNLGVRRARSSWVFICDDDVEAPPQYLALLAAHLAAHPECGAVSGLFLEKGASGWIGQHPEESSLVVIWKFLFQLGLWGEIRCSDPISRIIKQRYHQKGNHIARSGWPVITDMRGPFFYTPVYTLGAALVKRDWLLRSPFDESLDSHGIGDNYGVAIGFPGDGVHVLDGAHVFHHHASVNRIANGVAQERRMLALDYFIRTRSELRDVRTLNYLWSLIGAGALNAVSGNWPASRSMWRAFARVVVGRNPYRSGRGREPLGSIWDRG